MESLHRNLMWKNMRPSVKYPQLSPELRGKVVAEVMKGYYLNDKIIRFAKVIVGK